MCKDYNKFIREMDISMRKADNALVKPLIKALEKINDSIKEHQAAMIQISGKKK